MCGPHDISPPVEEQLVLELEGRVLGGEGLDVFPCSRCSRLALPLDKDLAHTTRQSCLHGLLRLWNRCTMVDGGQRWWSIRRRPAELLEETDVEHIVQPSARRKGQTDSDVVDEFDDAVGAEVARLELAGDGLGNGRS